MSEKSISVVIPVYNSEKTISDVLNGVLRQTLKPKEIIVVDDGSKDNSPQIIKSFESVTYIYQENSGPASARNRGAQESKGDFIFFTDSDCIPKENWVEKAMSLFDKPTTAVISGSYGIANESNLLAQCIHKEIIFRHDNLMPEFPKVFGSYNFGVRKEIFEKVKGFNVSYHDASGEDNDLSYKILKEGYRIRFSKEVLVDHYHPTKIIKYLFEQYRHGFWRAKIYISHPFMTRGDDYTFWKDIFEVVLVLFVTFSFLCAFFFNHSWSVLLMFFISALIILEVFFGFLIAGPFIESLFLAMVMFLRSFSRAFGFMVGLPVFFFKGIFKKK